MQIKSNSDVNIIKALCKRKTWDALSESVPKDMLSTDTQSLLSWLRLYYATYTEDTAVNFESMQTLLTVRGTSLTQEQLVLLKALMRKVQEVPDTTSQAVAEELTELAYSGEAAALIRKYQDGGEVDLLGELQALTKKYKQVAGTQASLTSWEDSSIDEILDQTAEEGGLHLRVFKETRDNIRGLRGGDLVAVAAPVDAGKTSLLACLAVDFAEQMKDAPDTYGDRPILWLVNESLASRTVPRVYQAATGWSLMEIRERHQKGEFAPKYLSKVGTLDRIRIKDAHSIGMGQIATLIEELKPAVLIIDMLGNVKGGVYDSEHQALEGKCQMLRELCCEHDVIGIGTFQLSQEGYDMLFPPLTAMKQSKIGVQGALDLALFMGRLDPSNNPEFYHLRGISTPKNKLARSGKTSNIRFEVEFNGATCQFNDGSH
ncbi:DNA helicase [Providencia phage vB_PstP_PS3]|uniref:DNA helicase n=1 Tax=Providencia phage vB_PstP_PS3 TaxID=2848038 RepID=A0A411AWB4_9CAUD|nr:DNA helicase [Providencia phage vB_PstP_PS3]QAX92392.1 DNA helicase [Providencia phage vB_PstP_PS3]